MVTNRTYIKPNAILKNDCVLCGAESSVVFYLEPVKKNEHNLISRCRVCRRQRVINVLDSLEALKLRKENNRKKKNEDR